MKKTFLCFLFGFAGVFCLINSAMQYFVPITNVKVSLIFLALGVVFVLLTVFLYVKPWEEDASEPSISELRTRRTVQNTENPDDISMSVIPNERPEYIDMKYIDLTCISRHTCIKVDGSDLSVSVVRHTDDTVFVNIGGQEYEYHISEAIKAKHWGYSALEAVTVNGEVFYLFFRQAHRVVYEVLCAKSKEAFDYLKFGGKPETGYSDRKSPFLENFYTKIGYIYMNTEEYIPQIIVALTQNKRLKFQDNEVVCE